LFTPGGSTITAPFIENDLQLQSQLRDHLRDRGLVRLPGGNDYAAGGQGLHAPVSENADKLVRGTITQHLLQAP
jgi:hypothetical protein